MTAGAPLAGAADFQAEWYYALLIFAAMAVATAGFVLALRPVRGMWRNGDHGLATAVTAACGVTLALFVAMFLQVVVSLLPNALAGIH